MLRSILVGLDGSDNGDSALELAIRWARRSDALLVGMGCIDEPGLHGVEEFLVGEVYFERLNAELLAEIRARVQGTLSRAALRCAEAGVAFKPLEDVGTPHARIREEAQRFDLIMLGQKTHFRFGWEGEPDTTLASVLADSPRPVVAVPGELGDGESVMVAYDGSLQASRAVAAFRASGLGQGREIRVVSVSEARIDAARRADRAVEYLKSHGLDAVADPVESGRRPADVLLEKIRPQDVGLLVMGAYGQPALREFFIGSATRSMMGRSPVPMFLYH
ncbi:universal stress protein [Tundrisphaera sp. TA3]|uniref:universal stress protein n=1 Tax=Tundrisphaera sp. TA3 TaxID=3435775 RepID=UPI003EB6BBF7